MYIFSFENLRIIKDHDHYFGANDMISIDFNMFPMVFNS